MLCSFIFMFSDFCVCKVHDFGDSHVFCCVDPIFSKMAAYQVNRVVDFILFITLFYRETVNRNSFELLG